MIWLGKYLVCVFCSFLHEGLGLKLLLFGTKNIDSHMGLCMFGSILIDVFCFCVLFYFK